MPAALNISPKTHIARPVLALRPLCVVLSGSGGVLNSEALLSQSFEPDSPRLGDHPLSRRRIGSRRGGHLAGLGGRKLPPAHRLVQNRVLSGGLRQRQSGVGGALGHTPKTRQPTRRCASTRLGPLPALSSPPSQKRLGTSRKTLDPLETASEARRVGPGVAARFQPGHQNRQLVGYLLHPHTTKHTKHL